MLSFYITSYTAADDFHKLYKDIFPKLWSLYSLGDETFKIFQKMAKQLVRGYRISIFVCVLAGTSGLPWYGNEYEIMFPVKVFTDILGKWSFPFTTIFYLSIYHIAFTVLGTATGIIYLVLHLYNQCFLLNKRLENLNSAHILELTTAQTNENYQNRVSYEMTCCIRHHQNLIK